MTSMVLDASGHRLKSVVKKPVVVIIEATWNAESVMAFTALVDILSMLKKIHTTETIIIIR